jgi:hypothetical protein
MLCKSTQGRWVTGRNLPASSSGEEIDILEHWSLIEADFQREYGINLATEIGAMSWRRFSALLRGLSRDSVFVLTNRSDEGEDEVVVADDDKAEALVSGFFA